MTSKRYRPKKQMLGQSALKLYWSWGRFHNRLLQITSHSYTAVLGKWYVNIYKEEM